MPHGRPPVFLGFTLPVVFHETCFTFGTIVALSTGCYQRYLDSAKSRGAVGYTHIMALYFSPYGRSSVSCFLYLPVVFHQDYFNFWMIVIPERMNIVMTVMRARGKLDVLRGTPDTCGVSRSTGTETELCCPERGHEGLLTRS